MFTCDCHLKVAAFTLIYLHSKRTLGQLLHRLREKIDIPSDVDDYLGDGIEKRNEIIHGFLIKNAMRLADPKGRVEIEKKLIDLKQEVKRRDILVNKLFDALLEKYGSSNKTLKLNADCYWEHLNPGEKMTSKRPSTDRCSKFVRSA